MDYARGGEVQKADAVGDLFVLVFDGVGAEEAEAALQFLQLLACHRVVGKIFGALGHDGVILAYSLFVRLSKRRKVKVSGNRLQVSAVPPGLGCFFVPFPGLCPGLSSGVPFVGMTAAVGKLGGLASLARRSEDRRYVTAKEKSRSLRRRAGAT